jgi:hypothetical protein
MTLSLYRVITFSLCRVMTLSLCRVMTLTIRGNALARVPGVVAFQILKVLHDPYLHTATAN